MKKCIYVCFHQKVSRPPTHPLLRKALKVCYDLQYKYKGSPHVKKNVFFRALPELPLPPPPPNLGNLYSFFWTSKTTF